MTEEKRVDHGLVPEPAYDAIPELSESDLREGCGFDYQGNSDEAKPLFLSYVTKALQDPAWLLVDQYSPDSGDKAQRMSEHSTRFLQELIAGTTKEELDEIAQKIYSGQIHFPDTMAPHDVMARAFQLMGEDHPNLMFYRGCEIKDRSGWSEPSGFDGIDFAPGSIGSAIRHAKVGFAGTKRHEPVIVMMSFADMGKAYAGHKLQIGTEGEWWRNSLEIHIPNNEKKELISKVGIIIRRPPADEAATERVLASYRQKAIPLPAIR